MFLEELGSSLVKVHVEQRERVPRDPAAAALVRQLQSSPSTPSTATATRRASSSSSPASTPTTTATTPGAVVEWETDGYVAIKGHSGQDKQNTTPIHMKQEALKDAKRVGDFVGFCYNV
ncbi:hypothetical protein SRHO_G00208310 [Serrasalmus rhombeus]